MDNRSIRMSPECVRIGGGKQREAKIRTPQPDLESKKKCRRVKSSLKRFALVENAQFPEQGMRKCIRVNSIFKSLSQDVDRSSSKLDEVRKTKKDFWEQKKPENRHFPQIYGQRTKINYFKIRQHLVRQSNAICNQLFDDYSLSLRGTHYIKKLS